MIKNDKIDAGKAFDWGKTSADYAKYRDYKEFEPVYHEEYNVDIPFTKETWHGRIKACRGIGASLSTGEAEKWETEHRALLACIAPDKFSVKHYAAMLELERKPLL